MSIEEQRHAFWNDIEAELGEPVVQYALGKYLPDDHPDGTWVLVYLTTSRLFLHHLHSPNWLDAMLRRGREEDTSFRIEIAAENVQAVEQDNPKGWLRRLFRSSSTPIRVRYFTVAGEKTLSIAVEHREREILAALQSLVERNR